MTTDTTIAPEVRLFLARVRHELADLDPDEVAEMTDGLEADLTELVAERGPQALGSPAEYAGELRAAAGLTPRSAGSAAGSFRRSAGTRVGRRLDAAHAWFDRLVDALPGEPRPLLAWLRPVWWIVRGWLAVQLGLWLASALLGLGYYESAWDVVPRAGGVYWLLLAAASTGSVMVGRGRLWPGRRRTPWQRLVLLGLNCLALLMVPITLPMLDHPSHESYESSAWQSGYSEGRSAAARDSSGPVFADQAGIYSGGHWVSNIYAYDAAGRPLVGVQLFDQVGRPLSVVRGPECPDNDGTGTWSVVPSASGGEESTCLGRGTGGQARISYPWTNGAAQLENVFPLPTRMQDHFTPDPNAFASATPPSIGPFPLDAVPPVSLPGITPSTQQATTPAPVQTPEKPRN